MKSLQVLKKNANSIDVDTDTGACIQKTFSSMFPEYVMSLQAKSMKYIIEFGKRGHRFWHYLPSKLNGLAFPMLFYRNQLTDVSFSKGTFSDCFQLGRVAGVFTSQRGTCLRIYRPISNIQFRNFFSTALYVLWWRKFTHCKSIWL